MDVKVCRTLVNSQETGVTSRVSVMKEDLHKPGELRGINMAGKCMSLKTAGPR